MILHIRRSTLPCLILSFSFTGVALAQSVNAPTLKEGDRWTYSLTEEKNTNGLMASSTRKWEISITRAGSKSMVIAAKPADSNLPAKESARDPDWSVSQSLGGKTTQIHRPYEFPMKPGKTWTLEYTNENPDARTRLAKTSKQYTVVGWVDVKVPAGAFRALKVEMEGEWYREFNAVGPSASAATASSQAGAVAVTQTLAGGTPKPSAGRLYQAYWYVPEIKTHIKSIQEEYLPSGQLNRRLSDELESYQVEPI